MNVVRRRDYDYLFKMLLIGYGATGKSCLLMRFADDNFNFNNCPLPTIGVYFKIKTVDVDGSKIKMQIWDT